MATGTVPVGTNAFSNFDPEYVLRQIAPQLLSVDGHYILEGAQVSQYKIFVSRPSDSASNKILHWYYIFCCFS
jgi:hypothetical protein